MPNHPEQGAFKLDDKPKTVISHDPDTLEGVGRTIAGGRRGVRPNPTPELLKGAVELHEEPAPKEIPNSPTERFKPQHHLLHIFDEPLIGKAWEGVLVGEDVLIAAPNGETYKVRGGKKPIYQSTGPFSIVSIKGAGKSDCGAGTRFYARPYRPSQSPPSGK